MRNAGIYVRVSTEHQAQEGYSVSAQKNNLIKFAKDNNFHVYSIYSDEGISAKNIEDRPEIKRLINDIENGTIEIVLIYKFDRLTRNISDTEEFINIIQKYNITIYTLSEGTVDVSTPQGRFVTRLKGAVAQLEREQISERIKVAFAQKVKDGYSLCSATTCYGYDRKKKEKVMTINHYEAQVVRRIFDMYITNYSFTDIANKLNSEGIPTKMSGRVFKIKDKKNKQVIGTRIINSIWQPKTIKLILSNSTYIGKVRYGIGKKKYFEANGHHEPIITQQKWDKVQEKIKKIKNISKTNLPKDDVYYCGTLVCGICGRKLTTNRTIGRLRKDGTRKLFNGYRCVNREKKLCPAVGISHNKVEKAFINYLNKIENFNVIDQLIIEDDRKIIQQKILNVKKTIKKINNKLKEIINLFLIDAIDNNQFIYMKNNLTNAKLINEKRLIEIESKHDANKCIDKKKINKRIVEHWKYLTDSERLEFITNFIEQIEIINHNSDKHLCSIEIIKVKFY